MSTEFADLNQNPGFLPLFYSSWNHRSSSQRGLRIGQTHQDAHFTDEANPGLEWFQVPSTSWLARSAPLSSGSLRISQRGLVGGGGAGKGLTYLLDTRNITPQMQVGSRGASGRSAARVWHSGHLDARPIPSPDPREMINFPPTGPDRCPRAHTAGPASSDRAATPGTPHPPRRGSPSPSAAGRWPASRRA